MIARHPFVFFPDVLVVLCGFQLIQDQISMGFQEGSVTWLPVWLAKVVYEHSPVFVSSQETSNPVRGDVMGSLK